jgi:hypothetical protein
MTGQPGKGTTPEYFGKYNSLEDAEKGFAHTVDEMVKFKQIASDMQAELKASRDQNAQMAEIVNQLAQANPQPQARQQPQLVDDEGNLDVQGLLHTVDQEINAVRQDLPQAIQAAVTQALNPIAELQRSKQEWQMDNPDPRFTEAEFNATLARNPVYARVFNTLVSNSETQKDAYQTVYDLWKGSQPAAPQPRQQSPERQAQKQQAGAPEPMGGQPAGTQVEQQMQLEELGRRAQLAQDLMNPDAQVAFAREFIKGSKLEKMVGDVPDWADDFEQNR